MSGGKPFNCWMCGACCHFCNIVPELKHFDRGDGVCINLREDNSCGIYESRPDVCNTRTMWNEHYSKGMTWNQYVDYSERICVRLDEMVNGGQDGDCSREGSRVE